MGKAYVVVGVGATTNPILRDATSTEEDWQAFMRVTSVSGRRMADAARRQGESWCVTVDAEYVVESDLDNDPAVRLYAEAK